MPLTWKNLSITTGSIYSAKFSFGSFHLVQTVWFICQNYRFCPVHQNPGSCKKSIFAIFIEVIRWSNQLFSVTRGVIDSVKISTKNFTIERADPIEEPFGLIVPSECWQCQISRSCCFFCSFPCSTSTLSTITGLFLFIKISRERSIHAEEDLIEKPWRRYSHQNLYGAMVPKFATIIDSPPYSNRDFLVATELTSSIKISIEAFNLKCSIENH